MLNLIFYGLMFVVFARLILVAIKMAWGIGKVIFTLVLLPLFIVFAFIEGLVKLCLPVLIIIGIISLFANKK